MARPKTDVFYVQLIGTLAEEGARPAEITRKLEAIAKAHNRSDWPSERTVRRHYDAHRSLPEDERRQLSRFRWPDSMKLSAELGLLPWEASRTVLDLVRHYDEVQPPGEYPTLRHCKWFWRVKLAAPTIPMLEGLSLARELSIVEYIQAADLGKAEIDHEIWTLFLAYTPWNGESDRNSFKAALRKHALAGKPTLWLDGSKAWRVFDKDFYSYIGSDLLTSFVQEAEEEDIREETDNG